MQPLIDDPYLNVLVLEPLDEVLSAHAEPGLVQVQDPPRRVLQVGGHRKVYKVVDRISSRSEPVDLLIVTHMCNSSLNLGKSCLPIMYDL